MLDPCFQVCGPLLLFKIKWAHDLVSGAPYYQSKFIRGPYFKSGAPLSIIQNQMGPTILNLGPHGMNQGSLRAYKLKFAINQNSLKGLGPY